MYFELENRFRYSEFVSVGDFVELREGYWGRVAVGHTWWEFGWFKLIFSAEI